MSEGLRDGSEIVVACGNRCALAGGWLRGFERPAPGHPAAPGLESCKPGVFARRHGYPMGGEVSGKHAEVKSLRLYKHSPGPRAGVDAGEELAGWSGRSAACRARLPSGATRRQMQFAGRIPINDCGWDCLSLAFGGEPSPHSTRTVGQAHFRD